jgi:hypothetical protein
MSEDREHKPAKHLPVPPPFAEPGMAPSPFFAMPPTSPTGGELVVPDGRPPVVNEQQPWPSPQPAWPIANPSANPLSPRQSPQGQELTAQHQAQLQRLCRHLRETDRCPGECVLSRARQNRQLRRFPRMR